jgi:diguanylate cyclase (GGDEF)-like protein
VFFITLVIFIAQILLMACHTESFYSATAKSVIYILLPVNIVIFTLLDEKVILSLSGKLRISAILGEYLLIGYIIISENTGLVSSISSHPVGIGKFAPVPIVPLLLCAAAFIFFMIRIFTRNISGDRLLLGVLVSVFLGMFSSNLKVSIPIFFSASGIMLLIYALRETYNLAYIDELTGLPSRRALREELMRIGGRYSIAMLDIDFFKKFNDTYGHDSGDYVLKLVGKSLKQVNGGGKAFRYGGEEFTIIFPGKSTSEAIPHLEKLRENIAKSRFPISPESRKKTSSRKARGISITISGGTAGRCEKYSTPDEVLQAADAALYRAKEKGRNCISK